MESPAPKRPRPGGKARILVRKARAEDAERIINLSISSMKETYGHFLTDKQMAPWISGGETRDYVGRAIGGMLVVEDRALVLGVATVEDNMLDFIWLDRAHRGRGLGAVLMQAAEEAIRAAGFGQARLEVFEPNQKARKFYESLGWREAERYLDAQVAVDRVIMVKEL